MATTCKKKLLKTDESTTQTNSYIVIHNSDFKTVNETYKEFVNNLTNGKKECTHYVLDDKIIYQLLKDNWAASHTSGDGSCKSWKALVDKGTVTNNNSIAIMVSDASSVDLSKSTENLIELIRHLMQSYNIPIDNVVRHGDTANKLCPLTIVNNKKWDYILDEIKDREDKQVALTIDFSAFEVAEEMKSATTNDTSSSSYTGTGQVIQLVFNDITVQESLSNANTSDNWVDMHKIKGITLHMYPPYHNVNVDGMVNNFKVLDWDRSFHYKVDYKTKIDFDKKPTSGKTTGGNDIGTSRPDVDLVPGDGLYSGVIINGSGTTDGSISSGGTSDDSTVVPSGSVYGWPLPNITNISSAYGQRIHPITGKSSFHGGIDIPADAGTKIHAYAAGKVVKSEMHSSYGNYIKIDHGSGCYSLYAHQSERLKEIGDTVTSGEVIGKVGTTGSSTGNHLHFEIWLDSERVNPATYVKPGGGNKKIPDVLNNSASTSSYSSSDSDYDDLVTTMDMVNREDLVVYDNIDKGTICFASEENGQHTYIERALFNNQHQKYTLSIGEFFDNQNSALEKDATYDYPKTEKKLIEQCAKALYDEGFSTDQLWREFDINRAPSPFLYLNKDKWILFLEEVQKQVDWLNEKYGKVTATYVPNNLLTNENTNEFIEMSPDLGINPNGGSTITSGSSTTVDSLQGGTFIGDSRTVMLKDDKFLDGIDVYAKVGASANYFYKKDGSVNRIKDINMSTKYILVWLGINDPDAVTSTTNLLSYLKQNFNCPIYVAKEFYVTKGCTDPYIPNAASFNKKIDSYNSSIQTFCSKNGLNFIDFTGSFTDGDYGKKDYYSSDGIHLNNKGEKQCIQDITTNITGNSSTTSDDTVSTNSYSYSNTLANIEDNNNNNDKIEFTIKDVSDTQADPDNKGKYCYVQCDTAAYMYLTADTASTKVRTCAYGDELKIVGAEKIFYKVTVGYKTGFIRAKNVTVIYKNTYGEAKTENINKECWTRFDSTELYSSLSNKKTYKLLDEQRKGKILDAKDDYYFIRFNAVRASDETDDDDKATNKEVEGWCKAYRITTSYSDFDYELNNEIEEPYTKVDIEVTNGDFEEETSSDVGENDDNNDSDASSSGWEKYGSLDFIIVENPAWDEEGHWNYRGEKFARLHSISKTLTGITNNIEIEDANDGSYQIRITAWIKQVTDEDVADGINVDAVEEIRQNGLIFALLDKNNKVCHSETIEIPKDTTKFGQRACVFSNVGTGEYKLFIGSNKKYDIYLDNVTVEQLYDYDEYIGDTDTSGNIGISGVGVTSKDNGGIMAYSIAKATNPSAKQPDIKTIITTEEYEEIMEYTSSVLKTEYLRQFEPYDKGLEEILDAPISEDDRLNTLTESIESFTGNDIYYNVVETGPGSTDHCVKPADELNVLYKQTEIKGEPIYPDLVIPPNYSTAEYDNKSTNSIPLASLQDGTLKDEDISDKKISYDYSTLEDEKKTSNGRPINYNDPYPYDKKIIELEEHYPKITIDEIESRLYSCNHPGCPIAHPMAKNFAMLNDMQLAQSKRIEQRIVRLENILSTMIRNIGRIGSRINVNCVYYGGQDIFGRYKTIRCTHDDRIHDGCSVTIDQCLSCTRYEPIIGAIYDILDETGMNGSAILDDMQMSYMTLDDFKNLNKVENRSSLFEYANVMENKDAEKPNTLIDKWKDEDKEKYKETLKEKNMTDDEITKELNKTDESKYVFTMDWSETNIDGQYPDVKEYETEGITSKYYQQNGDKGEDIATDTDKDNTINKKDTDDTSTNGEWTDTRKENDTTQSNKYTSEDFYFENFNKNRTGYVFDSGFAGNIGLTTTGSVANGLTGAECRNKIVEKAKEIVQLHKDGKAYYSNHYRTVDDTKRVTIQSGAGKGQIGYDCSSLASCCYKYAGLSSLYAKGCADGSIMKEIVNNGGEMWLANEEGIKKAMAGDCIVCCGTSYTSKFKPTESDIKNRKKLTIYHIMIYLGNNQVAHASGAYAPPKGIRIDTYDSNHYSWGYTVFIRPKDLIEADKNAAGTGTGTNKVIEKSGTIDGHNYVAYIPKAVVTCYYETGGLTNSGEHTEINKTCATHNIPYGTEIYVPGVKGKTNGGIFRCNDSGGGSMDFDLFTNVITSTGMEPVGGTPGPVYILKWGTGKVAPSYTEGWKAVYKYHKNTMGQFNNGWNLYKKKGALLYFTKFSNEDANIQNQPWYDDLTKFS